MGDQGALFIKWLVAAISGGFLVLASFYAMLEREVEGWQGVLGMCLGVVLTALAISLAASPWYFPALTLMLFVGVLAYMLTLIDNRIRARRMIREDLARYREAIEFDDKNAAAHAFLGKLYRKQRRRREALAEYERAVELDPNDTESRSIVRALAEEVLGEPDLPRCPRCEAPLDPAAKTCLECGWSRSTVKGLRDVYASGWFKHTLLYAILISAGAWLLARILGTSVELTLTFLLVGWLVWLVLYFWWLLREMV